MKKLYITPEVSFEDIICDSEVLAGSGGQLGNGEFEVGTGGDYPISGGIETEEDGESGAKGSFACWEDDADNWAF